VDAASLSAVLVFMTRHQLPLACTRNSEVVETVAAILQLVGMFQIFDHTQGVLGGILRGAGLQSFGAIVNVVGYYVVGAPVLYIAAFVYDMERESGGGGGRELLLRGGGVGLGPG
jgi:MATE family multidrug resistance protein